MQSDDLNFSNGPTDGRSEQETLHPLEAKRRRVEEQLLVATERQQVGEDWPDSGRLVAVDYGSVRIGLAICDPSRTYASPMTTYTRKNVTLDAKYFAKLAVEERVAGWIVGLPIHCDGRESGKSGEARGFAKWLHELTGLTVRFFDERYTSAMAEQMLLQTDLTARKRKRRIDSVAAHIILEHFLENDRAAAEWHRDHGAVS